MNDTPRMVFRFLDSETTGIPSPTESHALVELGWTDVIWSAGRAMVLEPTARLINAGRDIPAGASAVHGLRTSDLVGAQRPDEVIPLLMTPRPDYFVAHKKEFDQNFIGGGDVPWLCTHKIALRHWIDAPEHGVQALRYWLNVDDEPLFEREFGYPHHRAGPDSYSGAWVFSRLLPVVPIEQMVKWSSGPALLITCYLNKHRGKRWADVAREDPSYLSWIVDKSDMDDRDIRATARYYLKNPPPKRQPQKD